jgi:oligoribonuclease NrnB/cAMP/cGMP phosphodiesterase (DHH superfamily)
MKETTTMKTTVIHHSADFDGLFCREIARKFLPDAELIGWDYKDEKIPFPAEGQVYVLDLSPECFIEATTPNPDVLKQRLIWIDHHKTAIDRWNPDIPGYRIDGVAACRLAWQWFNFNYEISGAHHQALPLKAAFLERTVSEPLAVRLAGEYDIWDKRDDRADIFQFGLRSRELTPHDWSNMLDMKKPSIEELESLIAVGHKDILNTDGTHVPAVVWQLLEAGKLLQTYQQRNDSGMMHRSFLVEWEGLKFLVLNTARCNSLTFASKDIPETGHDALLGFYYGGKGWEVSLYHAKHRSDLDLSEIAKKHGGGGHRGACGFRTKTLPFLA